MRKAFLKLLGLAVAGSLTALHSLPAAAAVFPWPGEQISMAYQDKPLRSVLREFFASLGQPVVISERIKGNVTGRFDSSAENFFADLKLVFGLISYYDGGIFYVNDSSEAITRVVALRSVTPDRFRTALAEMGALDPEFTLRIQDAERLAQVSGPPRYVETIEEIANKLNQTRVENRRSRSVAAKPATQQLAEDLRPLDAEFRVFELRHGWAQDTTMAVGGREIIVPGLATTLRNLVGNYGSGDRRQQASATIGMARRSVVERLRNSQPASAEGALSRGSRGGGSTGLVNVSLPRIESDARTNSIIVHDLPERIDRYESLIATLDRKSSMVQIEATIVDISTDAVQRLGVDFAQGGLTMAIGRGVGAADGAFRDQAVDASRRATNNFFQGPGGAPAGLTTVVGNMGRVFLAQVNLLASEGKAYVHATPSVLTMNNSEAILENTQTFFVRVAGQEEVDLFDVTSGTVLRVTPVVIEEDGKRQVKLAVRIEDGSITGQLVDDIPVVQRSTVGTRALINEGQSLLIGGYAYSIDRDITTKIPLLGDIPALGALFTFKNKQVKRVERMFMITPRLVSL